jgi:hypothetical protein
MTAEEINKCAEQFWKDVDGVVDYPAFDAVGFANAILEPVEAEREMYKKKLDDLTAQVLNYAQTVLKEVAHEVKFQETLAGGDHGKSV